MVKKLKNKFMEVKKFNNGKAFVQTFDEKCYCINKQGEILFECKPFSKHYFANSHYEFDKWNQIIVDTDIEGCASSSVLDSKGNTIIPFEPNRTIEAWARGYEFIYRFPDSFVELVVYADYNGSIIDSNQFIDPCYIGNGLVCAETVTEKYWLYCLDKHEYIIKTQYDVMCPLENIINIANDDKLLLVKKNNYYGIVDYNNNVIIPFEYDSKIYKMGNYLIVSKKGKQGLITLENNIVYDIKYDDILYCYDDCIWCCENNIWKIVYADGREEILPYDDCQFPCENCYLIITSFEHTKYICVKQNGKWGVVDYRKQEILPVKFDKIIEYKDCNLIHLELNDKAGLYDFNGRKIVPCKYRGFLFESEDRKYITANNYVDNFCEYYDTKGNLLFKQKYNAYSRNVFDDVIAVHNGEYYKFITLDNKDLF